MSIRQSIGHLNEDEAFLNSLKSISELVKELKSIDINNNHSNDKKCGLFVELYKLVNENIKKPYFQFEYSNNQNIRQLVLGASIYLINQQPILSKNLKNYFNLLVNLVELDEDEHERTFPYEVYKRAFLKIMHSIANQFNDTFIHSNIDSDLTKSLLTLTKKIFKLMKIDDLCNEVAFLAILDFCLNNLSSSSICAEILGIFSNTIFKDVNYDECNLMNVLNDIDFFTRFYAIIEQLVCKAFRQTMIRDNLMKILINFGHYLKGFRVEETMMGVFCSIISIIKDVEKYLKQDLNNFKMEFSEKIYINSFEILELYIDLIGDDIANEHALQIRPLVALVFQTLDSKGKNEYNTVSIQKLKNQAFKLIHKIITILKEEFVDDYLTILEKTWLEQVKRQKTQACDALIALYTVQSKIELYGFTRRLVKALEVCMNRDNDSQKEILICTMELNKLKDELENRNIQKKDIIPQNIANLIILIIEYYNSNKLLNEFNEDIVPLLRLVKISFDKKFDKNFMSRYIDFYRRLFTTKSLIYKHHHIWNDHIQEIISRIETYFVDDSCFSSSDFIHNEFLKLVHNIMSYFDTSIIKYLESIKSFISLIERNFILCDHKLLNECKLMIVTLDKF